MITTFQQTRYLAAVSAAVNGACAGRNLLRRVLTIVKRHAPDFDEASLEARISRKNTYLSLTCTIRAVSRAQLDALYQELCDHPMVVMVL